MFDAGIAIKDNLKLIRQKGCHYVYVSCAKIKDYAIKPEGEICRAATIYGKNTFDRTVSVRQCTELNARVKTIYEALGYRDYPFSKRKSVLHSSEIKKNKPVDSQCFESE